MVSIILINYNNYGDTIECLESLLHIDYLPFQIILIDNNSSNDSFERIQQWARGEYSCESSAPALLRKLIEPIYKKPIEVFIYRYERKSFKEEKKIRLSQGRGKSLNSQVVSLFLIRAVENLGFAGANNAGILFSLMHSPSDYFWFLNNDTLVRSDALSALLQTFNSRLGAGAVGSKVLSYEYPHSIQFLGGGEIGWGFHRAPEYGKADFLAQDYEVYGYITGSSFLVKKEIIDSVGMWDEKFFMTVEDIDYSWRIRKSGHKLFFCARSVIYHKGGASTQFQVITKRFFGLKIQRFKIQSCPIACYYYLRNWIYFNFKSRSIFFRAVYYAVFLPIYLLGILIFILIFDDYKICRMYLVVQAFRDGLLHRLGQANDLYQHPHSIMV